LGWIWRMGLGKILRDT
jgi:putative membrane protein insertion efficiency factor